jgi:peptidoglycan/LPS O-acetylase OafA/YrhL
MTRVSNSEQTLDRSHFRVERFMRRLGSLVVDPSPQQRIPGIQGVRAVSAASILVFHIWLFSTSPGQTVRHGPLYRYIYPSLPLGVTLLFILSGFLLYRPFAAAVMRGRRVPSLTRYLKNRALRILPAYWFILLFASFVLRTTEVHRVAGAEQVHSLGSGLLILNVFLLQSFFPGTLLTGIGVIWALTDIVAFYLVLPLLVLMAHEIAKRTLTQRGLAAAVLAPAGLLIAIGLSGKLLAAFVFPGGPWDATWHAVLERSFWTHADWFGIGMIVAVLRVKSEDRTLHLPGWWWQASLATLVLIAIPTARFTTPEAFADGSLSNYTYGTLMAVVCGIFLALVVLPAQERPSRLVRVLETPGIVALGVVSYSLFIWQLPLILWMRNHGFTMEGASGLLANVAVLGILVFLFSAVTYRCIEFPALKHKGTVRAPADGEPSPSGSIAVPPVL